MKTHLLQETFGSAAQPSFGGPNGLAVDSSSGDLLVIDSQAKTVSRYNSDGTPDNFAALGTNVIDAKGAGQCASVPADCDQTPQNGFTFSSGYQQQLAIDSSGGVTDGDIYVTQGLQAAGNLIDIFAADGKYLGQLTAAGAAKFGTSGFPFSPCGIAVDGSGSVYLGAGFEGKVYKFDPSANPPVNTDLSSTITVGRPICDLATGNGPSAGSLIANAYFTFESNSVLNFDSTSGALQYLIDTSGENRIVSVDPSDGHLYVFGGTSLQGSGGVVVDFKIKEYDISGSSPALLSTISSPGDVSGLAANGGRIYADVESPGSPKILVYGPLVTVPDVTTGTASITGDTAVTVNGTVDPDGVTLEECRFEYGPTTAYGQTAPCAESVAEIGTSKKTVHADLSSLDPEALYHYRLVAKNTNATIEGSDQTLRTPGKPRIVGQWAVGVGLAEATLRAQINPENSPTTYRFEWGLDTSYGQSTAEIPIGTGSADHAVGLFLNDLAAGATYHYRAVASNGINVTEGPDHSFITYPSPSAPRVDCPNQAFRTGASANLPDCRAYEMVSPVDKNGSDIKNLVQAQEFPARLDQSSNDGDRFTYSSSTAFADAESAPFTSQFLASREAGGWSTDSISAPRRATSLSGLAINMFDAPFKLFSPDLEQGWFLQDTEPVLDDCAPQGVINLYRRDNVTGGYEALMPNVPASLPLEYVPELQGVSADGTRAVFRANVKLTEDAAKGEAWQLYEHVKDEGCGELRLISRLPSGKASTESSSVGSASFPGGYRGGTVLGGVSADGSRVFFGLGKSQQVSESLYVRVNADQEQSNVSKGKCSEPELACTLLISSANATFQRAAANGSKAIYTVGDDLFEFDVDKALAGETAQTLIAGEAKGVAGASEDASRIYFVSREEIGGEGEVGKQNLYLYDSSATGAERYRLVATLEDNTQPLTTYGSAVATISPIENGVRVTADGGILAFVSTTSLTGYDNTDAVNGEPDLEIFRYDAGADELACVSCNPSGARPTGRRLSNIGTRTLSAVMPTAENQSFAPRALSEDGSRLFFESFESLLPRDTNGRADVYEWQRGESREECDEEGAELFAASAGGCLSLISSGQSSIDSDIADVSSDGSDVFIRTAASLLPQDPGLVDIYDVRIDGGLPGPPGPPAACEGEACQGPSAPPNDPTPASSAFDGAGNAEEAKASCAKRRVRRKGRCVAKKSHKRAKQANQKRRAPR
jgi:hypothetical protein